MGVGFTGARQTFLPVAATNFILANDIRGNIFNDMGSGGYLIYRLYPRQRVFIDGRNTDENFFREYLQATTNYAYFMTLAQRYQIDYVLLQSRAPYLKTLSRRLRRDGGWVRVYYDRSFELFLKDQPANQEKILSSIQSFVSSKTKSHYERGNLFQQMRFPQLALQEYLRETKISPERAEAYTKVGALLEHFGNTNLALRYYLVAMKLRPRESSIAVSVGRCYERIGEAREAIAFYKRAVSINPELEQIQEKLRQLKGHSPKP